jgi:hypothetical protein
MPRVTARLLRLLVVVASAASSLPVVAALPQRTFVASSGVDTNPCTLALPCRGFAAAVSAVADGGEVIVLDSAGYGPVTILKSVSIVAPPGVYAGITVSSGDGITISGSGIAVALRGLSVNSQGGTNGIVFAQGAELHLERIHVRGFNSGGHGINIAADGSVTTIDDAFVEDNTFGVLVGALVTVARAYLDHVRANNNSEGIQASDLSAVSVRDSVAARNNDAIHANTQSSAPGASAEIEVENCFITHSGNAGIRAITNSGATSSIVRVSGSTITGTSNNAIASFPPATIISRGNNTVIGNNFGETFDGTFLPK